LSYKVEKSFLLQYFGEIVPERLGSALLLKLRTAKTGSGQARVPALGKTE